MRRKDTITAETIGQESYFNVCRLARLTCLADPVAAIRTLRLLVPVIRDANGNIRKLACRREPCPPLSFS